MQGQEGSRIPEAWCADLVQLFLVAKEWVVATVLALSVLGLQMVPPGSRAAAGLQGLTRGHVGGPEVVPRAIAQLYEELWVLARGERVRGSGQ